MIQCDDMKHEVWIILSIWMKMMYESRLKTEKQTDGNLGKKKKSISAKW